jgi:AcrR family transcriptional regulator
MVDSVKSKPGPKPKLSREAVVEAALEVIDSEGLSALNLRKLAARLGVSAMTPYSYFSDKAELVAAALEHALEPARRRVEPGLAWDDHILAALRGLHDALDRHPGVVELIMSQAEGDWLEHFRRDLLAVVEGAGLSRQRSTDALRSLFSYVLGYTVLTRMRPAAARRRPSDSFQSGLEMMMVGLRQEMTAFDRC